MHRIQRHILKKLTLGQKLRYKDLKPKEVEGNQFMYHMKTVMDLGYVAKSGTDYSLTTLGERYADRVQLETFIPRTQPKIVTMIYCENEKKEVLLFRYMRSPLFNMIHLPFGKIHMGEKINEAANRELKEKTGLSAKLTHVGDIYVRVYYGDNLVGHILHHIVTGKKPTGEMIQGISAGKPFWSTLETVPQKEHIAGLKKIITIIKKNKKDHFFAEFDVRLPKDYLKL